MGTPPREGGPGTRTLVLSDGWAVQSSALAREAAATIARPGYAAAGWLPTSIPATVSGIQAASFGDAFFGMNLRQLPGVDYPVSAGFGNLPLSAESPFNAPYWFRCDFTLPADLPGSRVWLKLDGINYRAAVYVNGQQVGTEDQFAGTFRRFEIDISQAVHPSGPNTLALLLRTQALTDLGWNWVDWNPFPGDKGLGLWGDVSLVATGPVRLRWPHVQSQVDRRADRADLTISAELHNASADCVVARLSASVDGHFVSQDVLLQAGEVREVALPSFALAHPRLWWPKELGTPALYDLGLQVSVDGRVSDEATLRFGVRTMTSELTADGDRLFRVNGQPLLIRGGGYAPDLFLRRDPQRLEDQIRYLLDMNLNTVRLEGKVGDERLYELCDQYGVLVLAGWCCCDRWEMQDEWGGDNRAVALGSLRDQARLLRSHPSALVWLHGSDNTPPPDLERAYEDVLASVRWPNPSLASANSTVTPVLGTAGLKMPGPYMWVPPVYWATDQHRGGAFGFNTETSAGAAIPPLASLRRFLAPQHWFPILRRGADGLLATDDLSAIDEHWTYHSGSASFTDLSVSLRALEGRYGVASDADDLAQKAQLMSYEGVRAQFEAYRRNKYRATGVIHWMLNNAWPGLIWHLYDYYLRPGGGFFGAQRAGEALHVQYGYDDRAVVVVSGPAAQGLVVEARVLDLSGAVRYQKTVTVDLGADQSVVALQLPSAIAGLRGAYLLRLEARDGVGAVRSRNLYWLSTIMDVPDHANGNWYVTPTSQYADLRGLQQLAPAMVTASARRQPQGDEQEVQVTLRNPGAGLAFFLRAEILAGSGADEVLPIHWDDNYLTLLSGEERTLRATFRTADLRGAAPVLRVRGINVAAGETAITP